MENRFSVLLNMQMDVEISSGAGFCFGVKRAIRIAYETREISRKENPPLSVYTYGPLVHNPMVIEKLNSHGILSLDSLNGVPKGYLIVRSHGIPPELRKRARQLGFKIVDATCPLVKKIHKVVESLKKKGYNVVVIGHSNHPEVVGIVGHAGKNCIVVEDADDVEKIQLRKKVGVVVQTTALLAKFREITARLIERCFECRIYNTICFETLKRQKETRELAGRVDVMIVAGGKNSSNTKRLADICMEAGTRTYLIEVADDLEVEWFRNISRVGVTAGASTPDEILENISERLHTIGEKLGE